MGEHAKDKCSFCGSQKGVVFITWIKNKDNTKGAFCCRKHEMIELDKYVKGE